MTPIEILLYFIAFIMLIINASCWIDHNDFTGDKEASPSRVIFNITIWLIIALDLLYRIQQNDYAVLRWLFTSLY